MSKHQLRLVDPPEPSPRRTVKARAAKIPRARRAHWAADWRLDASTRTAGRAGVAEARKALARARGTERRSPPGQLTEPRPTERPADPVRSSVVTGGLRRSWWSPAASWSSGSAG